MSSFKVLVFITTIIACNAGRGRPGGDDSSTSTHRRITELTFATYNTLQIATSSNVEERASLQINEFINTYQDNDILCLQELFFQSDKDRYINGLNELYPYHTSQLNILNSSELELPRIGCNINKDPISVNAVNSECIKENCTPLYNSGVSTYEFFGCIAQSCFDELLDLTHSECISCAAVIQSQLPTFELDATWDNALLVCNNYELPFNFKFFDSSMIFSKYPIINTYYKPLTSNLFGLERGLLVAEISTTDDTALSDNIFVACSHNIPVEGNNIVITPFNTDITNAQELNALQIEESIDYIFNELDSFDPLINPFIWMGDLNVGKLGQYYNNTFKIFEDNNFIDMTDIRYKRSRSRFKRFGWRYWNNNHFIRRLLNAESDGDDGGEGEYDVGDDIDDEIDDDDSRNNNNNNECKYKNVLCTWCTNINSDDYNALTSFTTNNVNDDLDHILIYYNKNNKNNIKYKFLGECGKRIFMNKYEIGEDTNENENGNGNENENENEDEDDNEYSLSDHYGLQLKLLFKERRSRFGRWW